MNITVISKPAVEGEPIPGYRILELLASGGMGGVYLAEDENLKRRAAIKFIRAEFTSNPEYVERFTREAVIVAAFQHANIVTVYASGWTNEKQYIVMEYLPGGALSERMKGEPLAAASAARISLQMADALAYAHERDVIHRDFKPANILLRENGTPVLSDFGIAKSDIAKSSETTVGVVMGNMRYMAPEQALGQAITNRVDVYSLGLVFHEMLTGELPRRHPLRNKQDAQNLVRALGSEFGELIARCLDVEPELRPSAQECREWLAPRVNRPEPKGLERRPALLAGAGAVVVVLAVGGVLAWRGLGGDQRAAAPPGAPPATAASQGASPAAGQRWTVQRVPSSASVFIDGSKLDAASVDLAEGEHQVVAVARGFYGEVRQVTSRAGQGPQTLSVGLEPTTLPSSAEEQRFLKLADAKSLADGDVTATVDPTFRTVLRAKLLGQTGQTEALAKLTRDVDTLQKLGDSRAAVAALLLNVVQTGRLSRSQVTQSLVDASDGGDAMASLFLAVAYREAINGSGTAVAASDPRFHSYCQRMQLAATQGWEDIASEYWRRDRCTS